MVVCDGGWCLVWILVGFEGESNVGMWLLLLMMIFGHYSHSPLSIDGHCCCYCCCYMLRLWSLMLLFG